MTQQAPQGNELVKYLDRFKQPAFYGDVTITYVGGKVTLIAIKQTLRPDVPAEAIVSKEENPRRQDDTRETSNNQQ